MGRGFERDFDAGRGGPWGDAVMPLVLGVQACGRADGGWRSPAALHKPGRVLFLSQVRVHVPSVGRHAQPEPLFQNASP